MSLDFILLLTARLTLEFVYRKRYSTLKSQGSTRVMATHLTRVHNVPKGSEMHALSGLPGTDITTSILIVVSLK